MGKTLTLTASDGHALGAYRADPGKPTGAGLVVIQEIFGVNRHIRDVCDRFAAQGYAAVAPALFDRIRPGIELDYDEKSVAEGRALRGKLTWDEVLMDLAAAADLLRAEGKVGVVGFCWGGSLTWLVACRQTVDAAVGYYGAQIIDFNDETPKAPTMLHFGAKDASIPMETVAAIKKAHPNVPVCTYGEAGHGFSCDRRAAYHPESARQAMNRTLTFLRDHLRGGA